MTAEEHRARCEALRGGMTPSEAAIIADLAAAEAQIAQAYSALSGEGITAERARSVANGIALLAQRCRLEANALEARAEKAEKAWRDHERTLYGGTHD